VLVLLGLFAVTGLAQGGAGDDPVRLAGVLVVVAGFLLCSVVVNDLADEAIDRVNLAGTHGRPLVNGAAVRSDLRIVAAVAGLVSVGAAVLVHPLAAAVVVAGLALSLAYSLRPARLCERGAVAAMLLPAGYVAVPYLVGLFAVRTAVAAADVVLLGGLYLGFIGRIVLKDFRDVRGDALFGKRTFLVRHGRRATCAVSAGGWIVGSLALLGVRDLTPALVAVHAGWVLTALLLLRGLARDEGPRRDERLISAIAIAGRGMVLTVVAHLGMADAGWSAGAAAAVLVGLLAVHLGPVTTMARHGAVARSRVPADWARPVVPMG
jgi:4-hydroxybenzoate polyprenyltransferase